jgi:hypothetical protein
MSWNSSPRPPKSQFPHYRNSNVRSPKEIDGYDSPFNPIVNAIFTYREFDTLDSQNLMSTQTSNSRIPISILAFQFLRFCEIKCRNVSRPVLLIPKVLTCEMPTDS